jgi:hypothetical protein
VSAAAQTLSVPAVVGISVSTVAAFLIIAIVAVILIVRKLRYTKRMQELESSSAVSFKFFLAMLRL